jgi:tRNA (guanine37-N1)-methyltransferase
MRFDVITIFPDYFAGLLGHGIVRRAREAGILDVRLTDLREFTQDRHRTVDDRPFGGGAGMVLKPEPLFAAVERLQEEAPAPRVILLSAQGPLFTQATAARLAALDRVVLICGRYEGVDERVATALADEELSVGDFVLSGGEPAAALVMDAVTRLLPGALGNEESAAADSFSEAPGEAGGILDHPHYTRPALFRDLAVPEILLSGHHEQVRRWRRKMALGKTLQHRPELLARFLESASRQPGGDRAGRELLAEIVEERRNQ